MGYQFCSKNCGFSIEHGSTIFRQNTNTEGAKMGYFHVTLTLLLSIAIMFAMTLHEALGNGECGPVGCPPGMKCVLAPPTPFVPKVYICEPKLTQNGTEKVQTRNDIGLSK